MKNANFLLRSVRKLYMYMSQRMLRYLRKFRHTEDKIITFKGHKTKEKLLNDQKNKRPPGHITHLSNRFTISNMAILSIFNDIIQFVLTSDYCPTEKDIMPFLKKKWISFTQGFLEPRLVETGTVRGLEKILKCWKCISVLFSYYILLKKVIKVSKGCL